MWCLLGLRAVTFEVNVVICCFSGCKTLTGRFPLSCCCVFKICATWIFQSLLQSHSSTLSSCLSEERSGKQRRGREKTERLWFKKQTGRGGRLPSDGGSMILLESGGGTNDTSHLCKLKGFRRQGNSDVSTVVSFRASSSSSSSSSVGWCCRPQRSRPAELFGLHTEPTAWPPGPRWCQQWGGQTGGPGYPAAGAQRSFDTHWIQMLNSCNCIHNTPCLLITPENWSEL